MLKLIIADDDDIIRKRLINKIEWKELGYEIVGEAADGKELMEETRKNMPDVILTDIKMPFMSGIEYVETVKHEQFNVEIVIVSAYAEFEYVQKLLHLGVHGYILKPIDKEELRKCMCKLRKKILREREYLRYSNEMHNEVPDVDDMLVKDLKNKMVNYFLTSQSTDFFGLLDKFHEDMCQKRISIDKMQRYYMYVFNGIYRAIKETGGVVDEIKKTMMLLFDDFPELKDQHELLEFSKRMLGKMFVCFHKQNQESANMHVQRVLSYIDRNFSRNVSMAEVANHIDVSYGYLSYILNNYTEGGFVRILRNRRIEEAKKMLAETDLKIYDIAEQCGFANSRYFSTTFFSDTGMTPTEYRRKYFEEGDE